MSTPAHPGGPLDVALSGTTSEEKTQIWYGATVDNGTQLNACVRRIVLRGTGGITAVDVKLVHKNDATAAYANIPGENIVAEWAGVPVAASATVEFLDDSLATLPRACSSLSIRVNVTAGSAWTIVGYVDTER